MTTKRLLRTIIACVLSAALIIPVELVAANTPDRREHSKNHGQRPGSGTHGHNRPGHNNSNHNNSNHSRPGHNNSNHNRPGHNNHPNKPGRPANHGRPTRPGYSTPPPPPARPYRPVYSRWSRPAPPPPTWRPRHGAPAVATILGLAFGTALGTSLAYLTNSGYAVDGYSNNVVYLRDVSQLNCLWPDVALYYDNGALVGSEYNFSTSYADAARYNMVYNSMYGNYGAPVSVTSPSPGVRISTWYTPGNGYVTLQYAPRTYGSGLRYYTTLTVGRY